MGPGRDVDDHEVVLHARGLVKVYGGARRRGARGGVRALDGVDLEVLRGEIFGFIGPNGAGKSTFIRVLVDLLRPTRGQVTVLGRSPRDGGPQLRARLGYLPGDLALRGRVTAGRLLADLARLRGGAGHEAIGPLAERFRLDLDRPVRSLSKGNKQKVGVIQAVMHRPELLILDEPTSGLDPLLQREFLDLIVEASRRGTTVFMSSHVLSEVEDVADRVAIIRQGRIVDVDEIGALRRRAGQVVQLRFASPVPADDFAGLPGVEGLTVEDRTLTCRLHGEPDALLKAASRHHVVAWSAQTRELEDLFLDFYRLPAEEVVTDVG